QVLPSLSIYEMPATPDTYTHSLHDALPIFYQEKLISLTKKGKTGADEIKQMMADLRANPPQSLGGIKVKEIRDYSTSTAHILYEDRKSTRLNSSHVKISYAVFCLKKKKQQQ